MAGLRQRPRPMTGTGVAVGPVAVGPVAVAGPVVVAAMTAVAVGTTAAEAGTATETGIAMAMAMGKAMTRALLRNAPSSRSGRLGGGIHGDQVPDLA